MRVTNIDTLSAYFDRLITENIKLYFFNKDNLMDKVEHQKGIIEEIKKKISELFLECIEKNSYIYVEEKRTYSIDDIVETLEELIYSDIITGEGDRDNLTEATSDNPSLSKFMTNHKKIRKANETRALSKNLLDKIDDTQKLIYASSLAIFGSSDKIVTEQDPFAKATNMYDYSLAAREHLVDIYHKNTIGLRFGSVSGFSKNYRGENLVNSITYNALMYNKITISNPNLMRALLGLNDLCKAILYIINSDINGNKVYNLSSINKSILEFGEVIQKFTGAELIINDSLKTGYSFQSSSDLFINEFGFTFNDSVESIFSEIKDNLSNIKFNVKRIETPYYV